jgi:hypothetical protein
VDTSKDIQDSIKDIEKRLRGKKGLVLDCDDPDLAAVVAGRGVGSESLGYVAGFAANSEGAGGVVAERRQIGQWVAVVLHVRDGDGYQPVKQIVGTHAYEESNAANPWGSLDAIGGWGDCAKQLAKDILEWVAANQSQLMARRSVVR